MPTCTSHLHGLSLVRARPHLRQMVFVPEDERPLVHRQDAHEGVGLRGDGDGHVAARVHSLRRHADRHLGEEGEGGYDELL